MMVEVGVEQVERATVDQPAARLPTGTGSTHASEHQLIRSLNQLGLKVTKGKSVESFV
jgi:hypothetical protein